MSKDDINNLGSVYGGMLNGLKRDLIKEGKVGPGDIGDADLQDGGPQEEGGFAEAEVDIEKLSDKQAEDNNYNIDNLSYTHNYMPEEDEENEEDEEKPDYADLDNDGDKDEPMKAAAKDAEGEEEEEAEDEESSQISEKIAQNSLNNFMKQKSVFDTLYNKVMVSENFDEEMAPEDFDALGIDDGEGEGEGDEVTISVPRDVAQTLCDLLQGAMGEGDLEDGDEVGGEEDGGLDFEEDEEGIDTGSTHSGKYDDGKNNKVGDLKPQGAASEKGANIKLDAGSHPGDSYDDGKSNKVGSLKTGQRAFDK